jgi:hypothetical protein
MMKAYTIRPSRVNVDYQRLDVDGVGRMNLARDVAAAPFDGICANIYGGPILVHRNCLAAMTDYLAELGWQLSGNRGRA